MDGATALVRISQLRDPVADLLDTFTTATPALLGERALLSRVDSKFVVPMVDLVEILAGIGDSYACLRVENGSLATYHSLYFDTPGLQCFHDHRRGRRIRHKVRIRHYPDRQLSYLEVKTKRNEAVTDKQRKQIDYGCAELGPEHLDFLRQHVGAIAEELQPQIPITYRRISLLGLESDERVTIDLGLRVSDGEDVVSRTLGHLAVIEVKQWPYCVRTPIMRAVRGAGHRLMSMSKYIVSLALMRPELCRNRLQAAIRKLERI
jgi:hypothetical protein